MRNALFQKGDWIFKEGEHSLDAYRILRGKVEISVAGQKRPIVLAVMGEGDIFGEMAMVDERPRSASARCIENAECEVMSPQDFHAAILNHPRKLLPYLATFFERLRTVNDRLHLEMKLRLESRGITTIPKKSPPPRATHFAHQELTRHGHIQEPVQESGPTQVSIAPADPLCASKFSDGFTSIDIDKYPFRIGRRSSDEYGHGTIFSKNDLSIADSQPYQVSRSHCSIEREGNQLFVRDRGSTLGTFVNDTPIGVNFSTLTHDLVPGENTIVVGSEKSPYKFRVVLG